LEEIQVKKEEGFEDLKIKMEAIKQRQEKEA
jgi:hypothetical protein